LRDGLVESDIRNENIVSMATEPAPTEE
jgi:hypothetical protein